MEKGLSDITKSVMRYVDNFDMINLFILEHKNDQFFSFTSFEEIQNFFGPFQENLLKQLDDKDKQAFRGYTFDSKSINAILRGFYSYEMSGKLTEEKQRQVQLLHQDLRKAFSKIPKLPFSIKTYRGVDISTFYPYSIDCIQDLHFMKDKYFFDGGYLSTTLIQEKSFFASQPGWGENRNIEIECLIPNESDDGIPLIDSDYSASFSLAEFLIKNDSLYKVLDVEVDTISNTARIKMILIPQKIWNYHDYEMEHQTENTLK